MVTEKGTTAGDVVQALYDEIAGMRERVAGLRQERAPGSGPPGAPSPLPPSRTDTLCRTFGLSEFERLVLVLCAGAELDAGVGELCRKVGGSPWPTWDVVRSEFPWEADTVLTLESPLFAWRLVSVESSVPLRSARIRIDRRILHHLQGRVCLPDALEGIARVVSMPARLTPSEAATAARVADALRTARRLQFPPVIQVCGERSLEVACAACAGEGLRLVSIRSRRVASQGREWTDVERLLSREYLLAPTVVGVEVDHSDDPDHRRQASELARDLPGPVIVIGREPIPVDGRGSVRVDIPDSTAAEQRALWASVLSDDGAVVSGDVAAVSSQFRLAPAAIEAVALDVRGRRRTGGAVVADGDDLWSACRQWARPQLDDLAQRIEPRATFGDLVLPDLQHERLLTLLAHVRQRSRVVEQWGFGKGQARGLSTTALFVGRSGTGKTFAAEVLANELRLDLYRIDLSSVVSKWIGETEKHLRRVFDAAEGSGAILLFDEADALFGKRSEVRDSHDRYANIEVSYLLQRMETYRGLAILTTNMRKALDDAFLRRIRFFVEFPFPDEARRRELWLRAFPAQTPTDGLDVDRLAKLSLSGGNIVNVAWCAAHLAADDGVPVGMRHVAIAARMEVAKQDHCLRDLDPVREYLPGWAQGPAQAAAVGGKLRDG